MKILIITQKNRNELKEKITLQFPDAQIIESPVQTKEQILTEEPDIIFVENNAQNRREEELNKDNEQTQKSTESGKTWIDENLKHSKELFSKAFHSGPLLMMISTVEEGKLIEVNKNYEELTGYSRQESIGYTSVEIGLISKEERKKVTSAIEKYEKADRLEIVFKKKSGEFIYCRYFAELIEVSGKKRLLSIAQDITEGKKAKQILIESEEKYRLLVNQMEQGLAVHEAIYNDNGKMVDYRFIECNESFERLTGLKRNDIIGQSVLKVLPETESYWFEQYESIVKTGKSIHYENYSVEFDKYFDVIAFKNRDNQFATVITDVTEKKKYNEEIIKAKEKAEESDRLKSAFLANMSHEIRTPMNGILGFSELLKEPSLTNEERNNYIDIIKQSGKRMLHTINDLINLSKIESNVVEIYYSDFNINNQLDSLYHFFKPEAEAKGIQLVVKKPLSTPKAIITSDEEKVYAILSNLIINAIKYTPKGSIEFGYRPKNNSFIFYVKDTGIGIHPKNHKTIFNRFIQADLSHSKPYEGAGLGLSITKAYVEMLGGKIEVISEEGKGSEFFFNISDTKISPKQDI